jgi:hypothetical protein
MKQRNAINEYDRSLRRCLESLEVALTRIDFAFSALAKAGAVTPTTKRQLRRVAVQAIQLLKHLEEDSPKELAKDKNLRQAYEWARRRFTDRQLKNWLKRLPRYQEGDGLTFAQVLGTLESVGQRNGP